MSDIIVCFLRILHILYGLNKNISKGKTLTGYIWRQVL